MIMMNNSRRMQRHTPYLGLLVPTLLTIGACGGDAGVAPAPNAPEATLGVLHVSPLNAIMAVGDTLTLHVTGQTLSGAAVTSFDSVRYVYQNPTDSLHIHVSPSGTVTAVSPTGNNSPALIEVIGFKNGLARADQAIVQVTASAIAGVTLSIQPVAPDSAVLALGDSKRIVPVIRNSGTGQRVTAPTIRYQFGTGDSAKMYCYQPRFVATATLTAKQLNLSACGGNGIVNQQFNTIRAQAKGSVWVIAAVSVYGMMLRDSVQYRLIYQARKQIVLSTVGLDATVEYATTIYLAPGGTVFFINGFAPDLGISLNWTFDNPATVTAGNPPMSDGGTSGNIMSLPGYLTATRRFTTPGTYSWTATQNGGVAPFTGLNITGQIIVE